MSRGSREEITDRDLRRVFLEPANPTHRQYEALRAYFVEAIPSAEAAKRFGYTPGSFRVLCHGFRRDPHRAFFLPVMKGPQASAKRSATREKVIELRKQNLSIYDISLALQQEDQRLSPAAVARLLQEAGFAKLPRRADEERPQRPKPEAAAVADVGKLDLSARRFRTQFGGLFLFLPWLVAVELDTLLGLLPISWSSDNGNHLFVNSVYEKSGRSSSIGTYLTQVAANSAGVMYPRELCGRSVLYSPLQSAPNARACGSLSNSSRLRNSSRTLLWNDSA